MYSEAIVLVPKNVCWATPSIHATRPCWKLAPLSSSQVPPSVDPAAGLTAVTASPADSVNPDGPGGGVWFPLQPELSPMRSAAKT